ncbi:hypothetical protein P20311_0245 [Pseudoalteromonas sp. BSi20311]|uniref:Uncharacterized protein n=1 Tax=Paraglaciecola polaris LMG 21857 TaxID=1129793 RepID=K6ZVM5_9ALTE|nr:hypothetical protein P20311_0245 [Pseudoalteromonas sp. BSi20311]GAC34302.1 hypothetical protein GPLA_3413 [Paraglaciecola polaris LMG 21857]
MIVTNVREYKLGTTVLSQVSQSIKIEKGHSGSELSTQIID